MEDCYICENETTPTDSIKCEGVCGKSMHAKCAGISKTVLKGYTELDNLYYICDKCVGSSLIAINKKIDKVMSIFHIYDERVTRYERDMKVLLDSVLELKNNIESILVEKTEIANERNFEKCVNESEVTKKVVKKNNKSDAVILIKPKNNQNVEKTENDVKTNIDPKNLKFNKICKGPKGGIAIVCDKGDSSKQIEKIAKEKLSDEYNVRYKTVRSKIKVIGIDKYLSSEEILSAIRNQNEFLEGSDIKIIHSYEVKKKNLISAIIEMDSEAAKECLRIGNLNIMWSKCRVYKHINLYSCYKCLGFNHKANECKNDKSCRRCAGNHDVKQCDSVEIICVNCKNANKNLGLKINVNHKVNSKQCTVYNKKVQATQNQFNIDFSD